MSPIVVATGFNREAAIVRQPGVRALAGGGHGAGLRAALETAAEGAAGMISFGLTGALADGLAIGDWVVGDHLSGAIDLACDKAWRDAIAARLPATRIGGFFADGRMIDTVAEKRALGVAHDALAVDMESHVAAAVAQARGLPFAILRCVSDTVDHLLPHAITVCMKPDGGLDTAAMLRSLVMRPGQLPDLVRTLGHFAEAMRELRRGAGSLGARLAFPE